MSRARILADYVSGGTTAAEFDYLDGVTSNVQTQLDAKVSNATHTGDVTGGTALTIATDAVDIAMLSATGTAGATTYLRGDNAWNTPSENWGSNVISSLTLGTNVTVGGNTASPSETNGIYKNTVTGMVTCYLELDDFAINTSQLLCTFPAGYRPKTDIYIACICTCWDAVYMCRLHRTGNFNMWYGDYVGKGEGGRTSTAEGIIFSTTWAAA